MKKKILKRNRGRNPLNQVAIFICKYWPVCTNARRPLCLHAHASKHKAYTRHVFSTHAYTPRSMHIGECARLALVFVPNTLLKLECDIGRLLSGLQLVLD